MQKQGMITKATGVSFRNTHPRGNSKRPLVTSGDDSKYVRCRQCGFVANADINHPGSGYGNESLSTVTTIAGGTANAKDITITAGCPFCGSSEYA